MNTQIIPESTDEVIQQNAENDRILGTVSEGGLLQPGEEVKGFRVGGRLSLLGGEAEIYLCNRGSETFVLKYYYTKKPNPELVEKVKSFSCQNIISILDYGEYKDRFFTILEYAEGGTLDDKLPDGAYKYLPMKDDEAQQIVRETACALEVCHKAGIIHRDIKPGNLFYKNLETLPDGRIKGSGILVGDFGIASIFDIESGMSKHMTETGAKTEGYAAPEAYSGVIGPEMDYYSLGITLWVLLTGMEPFVNEEGQFLYSGQITLDTMQGKIVENLLSRSPQMSASMQKLIRGLLTVRHDKRWKHEEVMRHLAGENVELFYEVRSLPLVEIGGESCSSYQEIANAIIKHPEEGKKFVFQNGLTKYLIKIDQKLTERMIDIIDNYSAQKREDDGVVFVAFSLCPSIRFPLEHDLSISSIEEMKTVLSTDPDAILPFLRDEHRGFYAYLEALNLGAQGELVKRIIKATAGDIRAVSRIIVAFQGNEINPFQDGINNGCRLVAMEDLYKLPDYLKKRAMIFIERNYGLLPAWIENLTGKNIDLWLKILVEKKALVARWGTWVYFILFMKGLDAYDKIQKNGYFALFSKDNKKALYRITASADKAELLYSVETGDDGITLKKSDVSVPLSYIVNFDNGYDKDGISTLPFVDPEGNMAVAANNGLFYLNIRIAGVEKRYELKEGEIALLAGLKNPALIIAIASSLKEKNNFADMNQLIDASWEIFITLKQYNDARNLLLLIDKDRMEGLSKSFDFYLCEIGFSYFSENSDRKALPYYEKALAINPRGTGSGGRSYNFYYASALFYLTNYEKALEYMERAIEIMPDDALALKIKGACLYCLNRYNDAIAYLNMALQLKGDRAEILKIRAQCYDALGMKEQADKDRAEGGV